MSLEAFPGGEIVQQGLEDLRAGVESAPSLLVSMAATRLRGLGLLVPETVISSPELKLYRLLAAQHGDGAHSKYNAWRRRLSSFLRSAPVTEPLTAASLRRAMSALGKELRQETSVYLVGGASAVLKGWRPATIGLDLKVVPDAEAFAAIAALKERLRLNIELASPHDFLPALPGWRERSPFVAREGKTDFFHFDFYSQALAKVERGFEKDLQDVEAMLRDGLVEPAKALELFEAIAPDLVRFPAVDPASLRAAVERTFGRR